MAISEQFKEDLRARLPAPEVIGRRVQLKRLGSEYIGLCPFHPDRKPSLRVYADHYHCYSCEAHGDIFKFVMEIDSLSFHEAVERLAADAGLEVPVDSPEERRREGQRRTLLDVMEAATVYFERCLRMPEGRVAMDYVRQRGFEESIIKRFRLGFAPDSRGGLAAALGREGFSEELMLAAGLLMQPDDGRAPYDPFRRRLVFPITDRQGRVIAFGGRILGEGGPKYRNSPETPLFQKRRTLYALSYARAAASKANKVIVTEGYTDVIALHQAKFENAVAPLGTALGKDQLLLLWRMAAEPILCFDGDDAGRAAAARVATEALPLLHSERSLLFAMMPAGEDPDTLIRRHGRDGMSRVLQGALSLSELLWTMECSGRTLKTAEDWARLRKRLDDHARKIEDPIMRSSFQSDFKDRVWKERGKDWQRRRKGEAKPAHFLDPKVALSTRADGRLAIEQTLLAIVINHPGLFERVEEKLGTADFSDRALEGLRRAVLAILCERPHLDHQALRQELQGLGVGDTVESVLRNPVIRGHRLIAVGAGEAEALETWEDNLATLRDRALDQEKRQMAAALGSDPSEEAWEKTLPTLVAATENGDDDG